MGEILRFTKRIYAWLRYSQFSRRKRHIALVYFAFFLHYIKLRWRRFRIKAQASDRKFIAIAQIEHLGEIVACEPIARYVRQQYPDAHIVWSVRKPYRELIDNNPRIDESLVVHCLTE